MNKLSCLHFILLHFPFFGFSAIRTFGNQQLILYFSRQVQEQSIVEMTEHELNQIILQHYKTAVCQVFATRGKCDNPDCLHSHAATPERRLNVTVPSMCSFVVAEKECPEGANCNYAHNAIEISYHPSRFRIKFCNYADKDGICKKNGSLCPFAHSQELHRCRDERWNKFDFMTYRVFECKGFCQCSNFGYHSALERRRDPNMGYTEHKCPFAFGEFGTLVCPKGDGCKMSHTQDERMFHPNVYRTRMCEHSQRPFSKVIERPFSKVIERPFSKVIERPSSKVIERPRSSISPAGKVCEMGIRCTFAHSPRELNIRGTTEGIRGTTEGMRSTEETQTPSNSRASTPTHNVQKAKKQQFIGATQRKISATTCIPKTR